MPGGTKPVVHNSDSTIINADDNDSANRVFTPYDSSAVTETEDETSPLPVYPATVAEAETFCSADTGVEFPQQIFLDDAKGTSIINCAQLFAAKSKAKPTTSPTLVSQKK